MKVALTTLVKLTVEPALSPESVDIEIVSGPSKVKFNTLALPAASASVRAVMSITPPSSTPKERAVEGDLGRAVKCNSKALLNENSPAVAEAPSLSDETELNPLKSTTSTVASSSNTM